MFSKKLRRAAAAAGLMTLLLPGVAAASWWDGGYDGRYDSGYNDGGRRGNDSSSTERDYQSPGENPPPDDNPPSQCGPSGCERYTPPPQDNPPPQCGQPACEPPQDNPPPQCGQPACEPPQDNPPSQCGQQGCQRYTPPPEDGGPSQCGRQGCQRYTPPPQDNPPPQCGQQGCQRYTPPPDCGQPDCGAPPPPPCGEPACAQGPPPPPPPPPPPLFEPIYGCENSDLPDTQLALHKTTTPPPGTPVRPGDEILVEITWDVFNFIGPDLHKAIDCVYINGLFVPELSGGERPTPERRPLRLPLLRAARRAAGLGDLRPGLRVRAPRLGGVRPGDEQRRLLPGRAAAASAASAVVLLRSASGRDDHDDRAGRGDSAYTETESERIFQEDTAAGRGSDARRPRGPAPNGWRPGCGPPGGRRVWRWPRLVPQEEDAGVECRPPGVTVAVVPGVVFVNPKFRLGAVGRRSRGNFRRPSGRGLPGR